MWAKKILKRGYELAIDVNAKIFLIYTESGNTYNLFNELNLEKHGDLKIIIATANENTYNKILCESNIIPIHIGFKGNSKNTILNQCIVKLLQNKLIKKDELIICVYGTSNITSGVDTIQLINVGKSSPLLKLYQYIDKLDPTFGRTLIEVLNIAMELGVEGREGAPVGTLFVVGDSEKVLQMSSQLILNPFECHEGIIFDNKVKGTVKELSTIDGAFIIDEKGKVISAGRYIDCVCGQIIIPSGLGARHYAAAAISKHTNAISIVISESGGIIRVFKDGKIFVKIEEHINNYKL